MHRWRAEEGRHAIALRDYLVVTRNIDPVSLGRGRMQTTLAGYDRPMRPANVSPTAPSKSSPPGSRTGTLGPRPVRARACSALYTARSLVYRPGRRWMLTLRGARD